jgi:hypothetical protein
MAVARRIDMDKLLDRALESLVRPTIAIGLLQKMQKLNAIGSLP